MDKINDFKTIIISFSHSNYLCNTGGTELFTIRMSKRIQKKGYLHICFFPIRKKGLKNYCGVIINDIFVGIYNKKCILSVIDCVCNEYNLGVAAIFVQHTLGFEVKNVSEVINHLNVTTVLFVHDLYYICPTFNMINQFDKYCHCDYPSFDNCNGCLFGNSAIQHFSEYRTFFEHISKKIDSVICPSLCSRDHFARAYSMLENKIKVCEHNQFLGDATYEKVKYPITISFCGAKAVHKGFEYWKALKERLKNDSRYRFVYLGKDCDNSSRDKEIFVDNLKNSDNSMINALRENEVSCGFLWSICPESYNYVYDEMSVNGIYVITNKDSGNIADRVRKNRNGYVYDQFEDFVDELKKGTLIERINNYRISKGFHPESVCANEYIPCEKSIQNTDEYRPNIICKVKSNKVLSLLYRIIKRRHGTLD